MSLFQTGVSFLLNGYVTTFGVVGLIAGAAFVAFWLQLRTIGLWLAAAALVWGSYGYAFHQGVSSERARTVAELARQKAAFEKVIANATKEQSEQSDADKAVLDEMIANQERLRRALKDSSRVCFDADDSERLRSLFDLRHP